MAPKPQPSGNKGGGRGKGSEGQPQSSRIDYVLPQAMVVSLQAITSRSTQDLWGTPTAMTGDLTVEQQAQKRAAAISKLSKRLSGNLKAKEELRSSLQAWLGTIGQHLAGLVQRARALGDKVDSDLAEACREMQVALQAQPSMATAEQVALASASVGTPIWVHAQEQEILRIAALLRAVGVVEAPADVQNTAAGGELSSEYSFAAALPQGGGANPLVPQVMTGHQGTAPRFYAAPMEVDVAPIARNAGRWRKREGPRSDRPSKSPRREEVLPQPWPREVTGRTPEPPQRLPRTEIEEEAELVQDHSDATATDWFSAWLRLVRYFVDQGGALVGEVASSQEQELALPLVPDPAVAADVHDLMETAWQLLAEVAQEGAPTKMPQLHGALSDFLLKLRLSPDRLPQARQGLVMAAHLTAGTMNDPFGFAPSTAQEWLFPALLVEKGGPFVGHVPIAPVAHQDVQTLLRIPCPYAGQVNPEADPEL